MVRTKQIGVFDSGFGGLDILKGLVRELPEYDFLYLGDTARSPYGSRSGKVVYDFTRQAVEFLFAYNCKLVILACNTASSDALGRLQHLWLPKAHPDKHILGVIIPAVEEAVKVTLNGRIGVMATEGTVNSNSFVQELLKLNPSLKVFQQACPLLVPLVEAGEHQSKAAGLILLSYLKPLLAKKVDTIILGCTHYGLLSRQIRRLVGPKVELVWEGAIVPGKLASYLKRHPEIDSLLGRHGRVQFYSTDLTQNFQKLGSRFFGTPIKVKKASLLEMP